MTDISAASGWNLTLDNLKPLEASVDAACDLIDRLREERDLLRATMRQLFEAASHIEATLRDDCGMSTARFCEFCLEAGRFSLDGVLLDDAQHTSTCPFGQLSKAIVTASQVLRNRSKA